MTPRLVHVLALAVLHGCNGSASSGDDGDDDVPTGPLVASVDGTVGVFPPIDLPAELTVGLMSGSVGDEVRCGDVHFAAVYEVQSLDQFPHPYRTERAPAGTYALIALLVGDPSAGWARSGDLRITITAGGTVELDGVPRDMLDLAITGGVAYACP